MMAVIVAARLRLRDPSLLDEFFTHAVAVIEQAQKTDGNLGADALAEAHNVWWDVTAWQSRAQIEPFLNTEPHLSTRGLADHLCDEASFVE
jgi:quinol monooxygenase YgiN